MKKCSRCGLEFADEVIETVNGQDLCDDCSLIISIQKTVVPCDTNTGLRLTKESSSDDSEKNNIK